MPARRGGTPNTPQEGKSFPETPEEDNRASVDETQEEGGAPAEEEEEEQQASSDESTVEEEATAVADYWEGHPEPPPDDASLEEIAEYDAQMEAWEQAFGAGGVPEPPTPPEVPGPPTPGFGMPAARLTDLCAHGGAITGPCCPTVLIGGLPAARVTDMVACPMFNGPVPHATGTIVKGSANVIIGGLPAARVSDSINPPSVCAGNAIALGLMTVMIGETASGGGGGGGGGAAPAAAAPSGSETQQSASTGSAGGGGSGQSSSGTPESVTVTQESTEQEAGTGTHWLGIEMVDEIERPVVGERYDVTLPNGREITGGLDNEGKARITGIEQEGWCRLTFPNLDLSCWERWAPRGEPQPPAAGAQAPVSPADQGPVRNTQGDQQQGRVQRVGQGDCFASIAKRAGWLSQTLWDHEGNAALRERRGDMNVLLAGDEVFIPDKRPKEESVAVDQEHKFRRLGEPSIVRMRVVEERIEQVASESQADQPDGTEEVQTQARDEPCANAPFVLEIDGETFEGTTDSDGMLEMRIPGDARGGTLTVRPGEASELVRYVRLGRLDPIAELSGVRQRLANLGFIEPGAATRMTDELADAIAEFQRKHDLPVNGDADSATRERLREVHRS